jgi:Ferric reductase like transmembrane component
MDTIAATSPSALWFLTRGTGASSLVLLTLAISLGVANIRRTQLGGVPRFVFESVHRTASLLAVSFLLIHIVTVLLDGFAPITLLDVVIPFRAAYRPLWVGFGAVAFDLMIAVTITSLVRRRIGYGAWRATHWLAYASWPVALVHGLGTGTDSKTHWMLVLTGACVVTMIVAVVARVSSGWPEHLVARLSALGAAALVPLGLLAWLPSGPLAAGWAKRAGTPPTLLASTGAAGAASGAASASAPSASASSGSSPTGSGPSSGSVSGRVRQARLANGLELIAISLRTHDRGARDLSIRIQGQPIDGGGVEMSSSRVDLGPPANPDQYAGHVTALAGTGIEADVSDSSGATLQLIARLQIPPDSGVATGTLTATGVGGSR